MKLAHFAQLRILLIILLLASALAVVFLFQDRGLNAAQDQASQLSLTRTSAPLEVGPNVNLLERIAQVAEVVEPAVVNISTTTVIEPEGERQAPFPDDFLERFFGEMVPPIPRAQVSLGSGVILDQSGFVLTNYHVVAPSVEQAGARQIADTIQVQVLDGGTRTAEVVGVDEASDLAVLKIDAPESLSVARIGDAARLRVGEWVVAIGNPFAVGRTVTAGIVSATHRVVEGTEIFGDYIQTDAAVNPGNSGGPLVNMRGQVVGINTFISSPTGQATGVGFAVPSYVFVNSYNQLIRRGEVVRGWLGVSLNHPYAMTPTMAEFFGVAGDDPPFKDGDGALVTQLIDEAGNPAQAGPAYEAGMRPGDVIVQFGEREVETIFDLRSAVAATPPGQTVPVVAVRKGEVLHLDVTLEERTLERRGREGETLSFEERRRRREPKQIGLEFKTLDAPEARRLGLGEQRGVLILEVRPGSVGDESGLMPSQVITHVNDTPVETADAFKQTIDSLSSGEGVVLRVITVNPQTRDRIVNFTSFTKP